MKLWFSSLAAITTLAVLPAQDATVTVLHGVPGLPAPVEVFANGSSLFTFDYGEQRGPLELAPGNYALEVRLNGATILNLNASLAADTDYSVIAHLTDAGTPTLAAFVNSTSPLALPSARLYVRHTADAPAVDVLLEQNGSTVATIPNLANGQEATADVAPGVYGVRLNVAGTTNTAFGPVEVVLEDGLGYGVFAVGDVAAPSFTLLTQRVPLAARVTVVHGIPGLPAPVQVTANGNTLFTFDFREAVGPLVVAPGSYQFDVVLNGASVLNRTDTVARGDDVLIVAHLDGSASPVLSAFVNDVSDVAGSGARVTVRHLAAAPAVDVVVQNRFSGATSVLPNLSNGQSITTNLPPGDYDVSLRAAGTTTTVFGPVAFRPGTNLFFQFLAVGNFTGGSFGVEVLQRDLTPPIAAQIVTTLGGVSCGPQLAVTPTTFDYGQPFLVRGSNATSSTMGALVFGDSITMAGPDMLPISLAPVGATGCFLNTNFVTSIALVVDGLGNVEFGFTVPTAAFGVLPGYFQLATMTTNNPLGVETSQYLELR